MNNKKDDGNRQNQKNIDTFYLMKKTARHHSHKKTDPMAKTYYLSTNKKDEEQQIEGPIFRSANNYTIDGSSTNNIKEPVIPKKKKIEQSVEQIYHLRKNAYKNYIKEIYVKINDELKKKSSYFNIVTHGNARSSYQDALVTKPALKSAENQELQMRKRFKDKMKLQKLQDQTSSLEKIKNKLFVIKKSSEKKVDLRVIQDQPVDHSRKKQELHKFYNDMSISSSNHISGFKVVGTKKNNRGFVRQKLLERSPPQSSAFINIGGKRKEKAFSLTIPVTSKKINMEQYIPTTNIFNKRDPFVCGLHSDKQGSQEKNREKILFYLDFLWKINYSNGLYIKSAPDDTIYKAYIGGGNNSLMIKSILKRRFWWTISDRQEGCNFVWTQLRQTGIFKDQEPSRTRKQNAYNFNLAFFKQKMLQNQTSKTKTKTQNEDFPQQKIFNKIDNTIWQEHISKNIKTQNTLIERTYIKRSNLLIKKNIITIDNTQKISMHNHLQHNYFIGNKKALFYNMKKYYQFCGMNVFDSIPLTFHIIRGVQDPQYKSFLVSYTQIQQAKKKAGSEEKNIWIVKPGEFSNRGNGITVCYSLDDIIIRLRGRERSSDGSIRSFIIQKYIEKPLLYKSRKFDIRHYLLLTCFNGVIKAYWYPEGYVRTSSSVFTLKRNGNLLVHLTNEAVQKNSQEYSKYQKGNKISYEKFQAYLDRQVKGKSAKNIFYNKILPEMKELTKNAVKSTYLTLDEKRKQHNFQLLGMDFMIDEDYKPWLIEINTNPCLELSCPLLSKLIPSIIENTFKICVDPFFPPPQEWTTSKKNFLPDNALEENRFELIFDESVEGQELQMLFRGDYKISSNIGKIEEDEEVYENDGEEEWEAKE